MKGLVGHREHHQPVGEFTALSFVFERHTDLGTLEGKGWMVAAPLVRDLVNPLVEAQ